MDELWIIGLIIGVVFGFLATLIIVDSQRVETYKAAFTAECTAKGGVPQFNYRSTDLCLPAGAVIPMEIAQ